MTKKRMKIVLIEDCSDCPYHNSYTTYAVECQLQTDKEFGLWLQYKYNPRVKNSYYETMDKLFKGCPLEDADEKLMRRYEEIMG